MDRTIKMVPKMVNIIFVFFLSLVCLAVTVGVAFIVNRIMPVEERYETWGKGKKSCLFYRFLYIMAV